MIYFRRVLHYIIPQYKVAIVSFLCAIIVAGLFSLSLGAMLPLMKVMLGEEGLRGWVNRAIVKDRAGITFIVPPLEQVNADAKISLHIVEVKRDSPAAKADLQSGDIISGIGQEQNSHDVSTGSAASERELLLERLAWLSGAEPVSLTLIRNKNEIIKQLHQKKLPLYGPAAAWLLRFVPQEQTADFQRDCITVIIIFILISTILRCTFRFIQEYMVKRIAFNCIMQLRIDTYKKTLHLPLSFFSQEGVSDTMSRFVQDSNRIQHGISVLFGKTICEPLKIVGLVMVAIAINPGMTLISAAVAPVAVLVIGKLGKKMKRATRRTLESWSRMLGRLQNTLLGIRIVKGYHREEYEVNDFIKIHKQLLKQELRMAKVDIASAPILETIGIGAACIGMIFAARWIAEGKIKTSDFLILVGILGTIAETGRKLGDVYPNLQIANASAERVYTLFDRPIEIDAADAKELGRMTKSLEMDGVSFTYPSSPVKTLDDISLRVNAGETIAVVGPNGSGKTTLLSLIQRFFEPDKGRILIDDNDISQVTLGSLREQMGLVTQQAIVFNDTIAANIAYSKPDASETEIVAAARQAYADDFIEQTSNGYQTIIGEQGATLSGGQLQRIAIARAILRNPAILIFDEAMSQIDSDSEVKIQKALAEFAHGRTSFIIAHRLSTVINADRIIVLDKGRLIGQGKHQELLESCSLYRQLYEMQFGIS